MVYEPLLKTGSLDNAMTMSHYTMLDKYGKRTREFLAPFYFYLSLVFYFWGAFLIKQLFHSRLLNMR